MIFRLEQVSLSPFPPFWRYPSPFFWNSHAYVMHLGWGSLERRTMGERSTRQTRHDFHFYFLKEDSWLPLSSHTTPLPAWQDFRVPCTYFSENSLHFYFTFNFCNHLLNVCLLCWTEASMESGSLLTFSTYYIGGLNQCSLNKSSLAKLISLQHPLFRELIREGWSSLIADCTQIFPK